MLAQRAVIVAVVLGAAGLVLGRWAALAGWELGPDPTPAAPPVDLSLLWIEEVNNRLLPPGLAAGAAGSEPWDEAAGAEADVLEDARILRLTAAHRPTAGDEPRLAVRYGVYDHDRLVREAYTVLTLDDLPHPVEPPGVDGIGWMGANRLIPGRVVVRSAAAGGGALELAVDEDAVSLAPGEAWAVARVAGDGGVARVSVDEWAEQLGDALDGEVPVTVVRLIHRGSWRVEFGRDLP